MVVLLDCGLFARPVVFAPMPVGHDAAGAGSRGIGVWEAGMIWSVHAQSFEQSSVAQSLDGDRLEGSLHVPGPSSSAARAFAQDLNRVRIRVLLRSMPAPLTTGRRTGAGSTPPCGTSRRRF